MKKEELLKRLQSKDHFILAIDGKCGSGKSTLGEQLHQLLGGNLFHMDDFYLPIEKRTKERYAQPGGNVDYERFLETVLFPLSQQKDVEYQIMDCETLTLKEPIHIPYHQYNIIEGSYSLHPTLKSYYTDCVVLTISEEEQLKRIQKRDPDTFHMFVEKWIPLENLYFDTFHVEKESIVLENRNEKE